MRWVSGGSYRLQSAIRLLDHAAKLMRMQCAGQSFCSFYGRLEKVFLRSFGDVILGESDQ